MGEKTGQARKAKSGVDERLIHVMAHRIRVQALTVLTERIASPKELAAELGESLSVVSHHVKELLEAGLIELVDKQPRRGTVEHFYRSIMRPLLSNEEWAKLSPYERRQFSIWIVLLIMSDVARAMTAGTFDDRLDRHATRVPLIVDEKGWEELREINSRALDATLEVQASSADRLAKEGGEGFHVSASILCIEMPTPKRRARQGAPSAAGVR